MNIEQARFNMIEQQIRPWDVLDAGVLALLAVVKREDFVPAVYKTMAFMDTEIPLPGGQQMLPPRVEARLLQALNVARHEKVLEIGTGSGFMAALLGHRAQRVFSLESNPELVALAKENLRRSGVRNVVVQAQDGLAGLPGEAPFDAILLSGSVAEVPAQLLNQLKVGGRLLAIVGDAPVMRATLVTRQADKQFNSVVLFDTAAPRLHGFAEHSSFSF
ncbi:protein-L-isoaspartate O-methyltransferase family protein [Paucibacter sp. KCTC 42545]|uniref:protein-L-isoaspartate O-methyltransferase family protein n=1 Tax=Paucibacter sp. KCTC 42545 TaxID=1768242 RepID=UPI000733B167|nr:protein-L-isoaspartate O-methyltransferase [Paucibacter sp. KCTC 42545]ALT76897.1 protein-L-isoaspartate O-methyltransferase [Paucibacter sp. KCTC 42545]